MDDLAVLDRAGQSMSVHFGSRTGACSPRFRHATGAEPTAVTSGDVNGDGVPDLVVASSSDEGVYGSRG